MKSTNRILINFLVFCGAIVGFVAVLILVVLVRTYSLKEIDLELDKYDGLEDNELQDDQFLKFLNLFGESLKFKTVSTAPGQYDKDELLKFQSFLKKSFPLVFDSPYIEVEIIRNYSMLLSIKGYNEDLKPFMLISHLDVVPVFTDQWRLDPYLGEISHNPFTGEDEMWGRGSIDNKNAVLGILSALELLLQSQWRPLRSFYVGFGHDEEVGGKDGAMHIAKTLEGRGVTFDFLLDEGVPLCEGVIKGVSSPIALIGVTEKGRMNVEISVEAVGGHSSMPPKEQAIGILASALKRLYDNPQPSMFGLGPEVDMLRYLAPMATWPYNCLYANTWLFGPLLASAMSLKRESDALIRTTTAFTMVNAGIKDNIVPESSWALLNHRVHPGQSLEDVLAHDIATVNDDRVKFKVDRQSIPHPISPYGPDSLPFKLIARAVKDSFSGVIPVPALTVGNTDSRHYLNLTSNIYRLNPSLLHQEGIKLMHGNNEWLSDTNFRAAILFYRRIIKLAEASAESQPSHSSMEL